MSFCDPSEKYNITLKPVLTGKLTGTFEAGEPRRANVACAAVIVARVATGRVVATYPYPAPRNLPQESRKVALTYDPDIDAAFGGTNTSQEPLLFDTFTLTFEVDSLNPEDVVTSV